MLRRFFNKKPHKWLDEYKTQFGDELSSIMRPLDELILKLSDSVTTLQIKQNLIDDNFIRVYEYYFNIKFKHPWRDCTSSSHLNHKMSPEFNRIFAEQKAKQSLFSHRNYEELKTKSSNLYRQFESDYKRVLKSTAALSEDETDQYRADYNSKLRELTSSADIISDSLKELLLSIESSEAKMLRNFATKLNHDIDQFYNFYKAAGDLDSYKMLLAIEQFPMDAPSIKAFFHLFFKLNVGEISLDRFLKQNQSQYDPNDELSKLLCDYALEGDVDLCEMIVDQRQKLVENHLQP